MPVFSYKGYNSKTGDSVKGKIDADTSRSARQKLKQSEGIIVAELKEEAAKVSSSGSKPGLFSTTSGPKVGTSDLSVMTRQFATLQSAYVPLDDSLRALCQQVENETLAAILGKVKDGVSEGKSLGEALSGYPGVFNKLYVNMVSAGEVSGQLGLVLERLADFQEYQAKLKSDLFSAISYPALMILASGGIIGYLFISVVPKLQKIFDSLKVKLFFHSAYYFIIGVSPK